MEIKTKILRELSKNFRISMSELARRLKITREKADREIIKLQRDTIIERLGVTLNPGKFGYETWQIYISLDGSKKESNRDVQRFFKQNKLIVKTLRTIGQYDYVISVVGKNSIQVNGVVNQLKKELNVKKIKQVLLIPSDSDFSNKSISSADKKIISALTDNARLTLKEISQKTKLTQRVVGYRLNELLRKEILISDLNFNSSKLGLEKYKLLINNIGDVNELVNFIEKNLDKNSLLFNYNKTLGAHEIELDLVVKNHSELVMLENKLMDYFRVDVLHLLEDELYDVSHVDNFEEVLKSI
ncbi:winged helix-turn-helix transcriptional regulator [Candidatus Woesearchaeota archaeon]|jgi:Lrp/AsnC family transcriptional regulator, leucine-responsive regulatory protein|nr:winged helix-turn-helix transcriptional regulator [Candidatus Woesearchaeota archaeon]MBT6519254.1 winged helix-turn-helix transcriptional regulator [Candidatus Woesearchaeota archaeon]MBT7368446.1 winged helix-turn-helix transcriptional regulator [Candidatus Woesearchaeota archaeon]